MPFELQPGHRGLGRVMFLALVVIDHAPDFNVAGVTGWRCLGRLASSHINYDLPKVQLGAGAATLGGITNFNIDGVTKGPAGLGSVPVSDKLSIGIIHEGLHGGSMDNYLQRESHMNNEEFNKQHGNPYNEGAKEIWQK